MKIIIKKILPLAFFTATGLIAFTSKALAVQDLLTRASRNVLSVQRMLPKASAMLGDLSPTFREMTQLPAVDKGFKPSSFVKDWYKNALTKGLGKHNSVNLVPQVLGSVNTTKHPEIKSRFSQLNEHQQLVFLKQLVDVIDSVRTEQEIAHQRFLWLRTSGNAAESVNLQLPPSIDSYKRSNTRVVFGEPSSIANFGSYEESLRPYLPASLITEGNWQDATFRGIYALQFSLRQLKELAARYDSASQALVDTVGLKAIDTCYVTISDNDLYSRLLGVAPYLTTSLVLSFDSDGSFQLTEKQADEISVTLPYFQGLSSLSFTGDVIPLGSSVFLTWMGPLSTLPNFNFLSLKNVNLDPQGFRAITSALPFLHHMERMNFYKTPITDEMLNTWAEDLTQLPPSLKPLPLRYLGISAGQITDRSVQRFLAAISTQKRLGLFPELGEIGFIDSYSITDLKALGDIEGVLSARKDSAGKEYLLISMS